MANRTHFHKTDIGQVDDRRHEKAAEMAESILSKYFESFPDVDLDDLLVIILREANWQCSLALLNGVKEDFKND